MLRQTILLALLLGIHAAAPRTADGAANRTTGDANRTAAGNTTVMLFGLPAGGAYDIRHNGSMVGTANAGPAGSVVFATGTQTGDELAFLLTGIEAVEPSAPVGFTARGNTEGCVDLSWTTPPPGEYVTDYALLWGATPGVYGDSLMISRLEIVNANGTSSTRRCGFPSGTYHFALRAHNSFDLWSGLSQPATTTISNENTAGPPAPTNVAASETPPGCARVTWKASSDPNVTGYRVYRGTVRRAQGAYIDSLEVNGTGTTTASFCGLTPGNAYLAVRAVTSTGLLSAYSNEVSLSIVGPDVTAPTFSQIAPADGATHVALNATFFFVLHDDRSGVNPSSVSVRVNGVVCSPSGTIRPDGGLSLQCAPGSMSPNALQTVEVTAADKASPVNVLTTSWTFTTGANSVNDITAPVISGATPAPDAVAVPVTAPIEITIADTGLGVDFSTIQMTVDGQVVEHEVNGSPASVRVSYRPSTPMASGATVRITVEACDAANPRNCADFSFSFSLAAAQVASSPGEIVPDGFWEGDRRRPMEVRDLPPSWGVRIFDAAGTPVRRFENRDGGVQTWTWDFRNDSGQRVAPALYLVRVTDEAGSVKETGRFVVQSY
jgi:hypothetical protein